MKDTRHKNKDWNLGEVDSQGRLQWQQIELALAMDIRDELRRLNALLHCPNFTAIPSILRTIRRSTSDLRKQKKPASRKV